LLWAWLAALQPGATDADLNDLTAPTGVAVESLRALAALVSAAERPVIVYGEGLASDEPEAVAQLYALARQTGRARLLALGRRRQQPGRSAPGPGAAL
jgi:thiamine pyrophosphate-dependent acetolactate synthase large subunit-like protein